MAEVIQAGDDQQAGKQAGAVIAGVTELLPVFRQRAQEAEDGRVVPAESVKALAETGFFRLLQPRCFGGLEADPVTFLGAVRLIASACGSTGWVASVVGVHPWQLALFPPQAQDDVWGADPATRMSSSYAPTGKATQAVSADPLPLRLRVRRDQVTGTGQAIRAVDLLFENSGGRALKMGTPIQRFWRDAHAGRVHAINDPERALAMFGRGEFGYDVPPDAMF